MALLSKPHCSICFEALQLLAADPPKRLFLTVCRQCDAAAAMPNFRWARPWTPGAKIYNTKR